MKKQNIIVLLLMILIAGISYAASVPNSFVWNKPVGGAGGKISGAAVELNVTVLGNDGFNATNITFYYSTDNTTWTQVGNATFSLCTGTAPRNCTGFNRSMSSAGLFDVNQYYFKATVHNITVDANAVNYYVHNIYVDNTAPVVSLTTPIEMSELNKDTIFTFSSVNSTSCTLFMDNQPSIAMTHNGNATWTCTYTFDDHTFPDGSYNNVRVISSDGVTTTTSNTYKFLISNTKGGGGYAMMAQQQAQQSALKQTTSTSTGGFNNLTIVALLIAAYVIFVHNKKR